VSPSLPQTTYSKDGLADPGYGEIFGFDHVHWCAARMHALSRSARRSRRRPTQSSPRLLLLLPAARRLQVGGQREDGCVVVLRAAGV
jgi:hypothetical protein